MGWIRMDYWPEVVERLPLPLTREEALTDLRWHFYEAGGWPSLRRLAARWGWISSNAKPAVKRVRLLIKGELWRDPFLDAKQRGTTGAQQGHTEGTARAQQGHSQKGAKQAIPEERAQEGHTEGTARAQEGHKRGNTRVDLNPTLPNPNPTQEQHTSEQASPAKPGRPPEGDRAYRRWAFHECMKFWHEMRQEQGKRKRTLDPNGKANTEGGSLWRMVGTTRESLEPLIRVLSYIRWAEDDQPGGATYYRSKGLALVNIRRHLAELDLKAQDYHDANGGWKPRSMQSRRRETEAYEEPTPERLDEIRAYFAARAAQ